MYQVTLLVPRRTDILAATEDCLKVPILSHLGPGVQCQMLCVSSSALCTVLNGTQRTIRDSVDGDFSPISASSIRMPYLGVDDQAAVLPSGNKQTFLYHVSHLEMHWLAFPRARSILTIVALFL